jgi:hypothetical protein
MRADKCAGKGTSGMDKFGSIVDRMCMKLGSKWAVALGCLVFCTSYYGRKASGEVTLFVGIP